MEYKTLTPALGAVIEGIDLSDLPSEAQVSEIMGILQERLIVAIPEQHVTAKQQRDFALNFGPLYTHPFYAGVVDAPEVMVLEHDDRRRAAQNAWHSDVTYLETPPHVEVLCAELVPPHGGDTIWASTYAAYEALSPALQRFLDGLHAVHDFAKDFPPSRFEDAGVRAPADVYSKHPPVVHPVVRTNRANGRKALFVNTSFTTHIEGVTRKESDAILRLLFEHIERPEFHARWRWHAGDVVLWDNRWTQHYAVSDYFPERRRMRRVSAIGDRPV
ncbi:MAG TPA: taurine dioxygenase [Candidatus Acidoferrales bacterium]|jgi:taurine dioxygenase|nr:taurine dioxygenase [Candidatus Acidoferrales bacterium]